MQAIILAAGLGTRLRPLTYAIPKALIPVLNRPLLGVLLAQLREAGAHRVAVNTHHLAGRVEGFLQDNRPRGLEVLVRHEPEILGTGGGLRSLGQALEDQPFLAVNADMAYTGVQVVSPRMLSWLPAEGPADLVAAWRHILAQGEFLAARVVSGHFWQDLGTPEAYLTAHQKLLSGACPGLAGFFPRMADPLVGEGTRLEEGVSLAGGVCLGRDVRVGQGTWLKNTVVWDGARIGPGLTLENCVVGQGGRVTVSARDEVIV
ncbi:MAG: NDP-sugar synthase [Syntrophobacterales bacterium]